MLWKNFNSHQFQNYPDNITVLAQNGLNGPDYHYVLHIGAVFSQYSLWYKFCIGPVMGQ